MSLRGHPEALAELAATASWYEGQEPGLGVRFVTEVERLSLLLEEFPDLGAAVEIAALAGTLRQAPTRVFPFLLIYDPTDRFVIAVAQERRAPGFCLPESPGLSPGTDSHPRLGYAPWRRGPAIIPGRPVAGIGMVRWRLLWSGAWHE